MHFWFKDRPVKTGNFKDGVRLTMKSGKILETEAAIFAAGRRAAVDGLALEKAGLGLNDRQGTSSAFPRMLPPPWSKDASLSATPSV